MSQSEHNSIKIEEQDYKEHGDDDGLYDSPNQMNAEEEELQQIGQNGQPQLIKKRTHRKLQISNFIMKTYRILQDKKISDIVEWTDQGNCFIVKNKQNFSNQILPKYFKHNKFSSFVRQLNMYDFHKIRKQKQIPIFKHKYFKMGYMDLLHKIKRKSGEQGKEEDSMVKGMNISKQNLNLSQQLIGQGSMHPILLKNKQTSCHNSLQSDIEMIKKQNMDLHHSISEMTHQISELQLNREKKKEKLVKIVTSLMFFVNQPKQCENPMTLRQLQNHFMKEEQPFSFTQYTQKLSSLYLSLQHNLL